MNIGTTPARKHTNEERQSPESGDCLLILSVAPAHPSDCKAALCPQAVATAGEERE